MKLIIAVLVVLVTEALLCECGLNPIINEPYHPHKPEHSGQKIDVNVEVATGILYKGLHNDMTVRELAEKAYDSIGVGSENRFLRVEDESGTPYDMDLSLKDAGLGDNSKVKVKFHSLEKELGPNEIHFIPGTGSY